MDIAQIAQNPQIIAAIAKQLGMTPEELIQQVQQNPQIAQQILDMMSGQGSAEPTGDASGANWMDQAAAKQAAPGARPAPAEVDDGADDESVE